MVKVSLHTLVMASLFIGRDPSTLRLRGEAFYGAFNRAFDGAFEGPSTGPSTGPSRRRVEGMGRHPSCTWVFVGAGKKAFGGSSKRRIGALTGPSTGPLRRRLGASRRRSGVFSELNSERKRRLHPLGEYIITLSTNGKLRTRVTITLVNGAEGHTLKGAELRVADSHTSNHNEDDFTPSETFKDFPSAFGMLLQRLHAVEKAATKWQATTNVALCCEGCNKAYLQLRRLPHRLQATAKAATLLTGCYKGLIIAGPTDDAIDYAKRSTYQAPMEAVTHVMRRSWVAVMEIMPIDQGLRRGLRGVLRGLLQGLLRGLKGEGQGLFEEKAGGFDRAFYGEKTGGFDRAFYGAFEEKVGGFEEKAEGLLQT
ncbi:hypothetical protein Tco_0978959 [Tanacetum coccineum]|uniref:Uncharacterized protein n=1 Tax=Tanacetum coccineum TaxID=301880 RepID=A0ABQ5EPJ6_9ASTR